MKFSEFLRKQPPKANLYMFVCEDDFLVDESQSVWARCFGGEWRFQKLPLKEFDTIPISDLMEWALTPPLFGPARALIVTGAGKLTRKRTTELEPLSAVEHSSLKIVFVLSSRPSRSRPPFPLIQIDRLRPEDMVRWLSGRFGVTLEVARYLVDNLVPELLPLKQEVEKLQTYVGGARQVEIADVDQLIFRSEQYGPFELDDAFLAKDYPKSVRVLGAMVEEGVEPILILSKLVRYGGRYSSRRYWRAGVRRQRWRAPRECRVGRRDNSLRHAERSTAGKSLPGSRNSFERTKPLRLRLRTLNTTST